MTAERSGHVSFKVQDDKINDEDDDVAMDIPSVNKRLGQLRPSRELLEYYRKKIAEFDGEHEDMLCRLEQYKMTYEQQVITIILGCYKALNPARYVESYSLKYETCVLLEKWVWVLFVTQHNVH